MEFVSYEIEGNDFARAGAASRAIKNHLKRIGARSDAIRRTMIAAYEAEMNVVIHAHRGRLEATLSDRSVDVTVVDEGPGIPDLDAAMREGFSTAGADARALGFGAGLGLPNIKRNSDRMRLSSTVGEGTKVSFTVFLEPQSTMAPPLVSLYASADRCKDCRRCLTACPTGAIRVRDGLPSVLEHLCIDCTRCIAVCSPGALTIVEALTGIGDVRSPERTSLAVPPAFLASFPEHARPAQVLGELRELGFSAVETAYGQEQALRDAVMHLAADESAARPLISPACPAVVDLIQLRFPSLLPNVAPFASPWEALAAAHEGERVAYVVSCPSQRSALLAAAGPVATHEDDAALAVELLTPALLTQAVLARIAGRPVAAGETVPAARPDPSVEQERAAKHEPTVADRASAAVGSPASEKPAGLLRVTGIDHVLSVLERLENGLLSGVRVVEPFVCDGGCFGSPLLPADPSVATYHWRLGEDDLRAAGALTPGRAVPREIPLAARPGIRLDDDMDRAIEKLARLDAAVRALPGKDCGACGAPTCAALAEDIVMERASRSLCPYVDIKEGPS